MKSSNKNWTQCSGEVETLVGQLQSAQQRVGLRTMLVKGVAACAVLLACFFAYQSATQAAPKPISCRTVIHQTEQISAGTLDSEMQRRVDAHLAYCNSCRDHVAHARITVASGAEVEFGMLAAL